jgi:hypothetical protein
LKTRLLLTLSALLVLAALWPLIAEGQFNPDLCEDPANLLPNCGFSEGMEPWVTFVEGGNPSITWANDPTSCHAINIPCIRLASENPFVGGIYQQVSGLTPGVTYHTNVTLLWMNSLNKTDRVMGRKIGIDPTGGTNPQSPDIVWSGELWGTEEQKISVTQSKLYTSAVAQGDTVTIFVRIDAPREVQGVTWPGVDELWIDDVGMVAGEETAPTAAPQPPTDTPAPPTPIPEPPTNTPQPPPETPVVTPTVELTATTPITPTATPTSTPTATATPTVTPTPTVTRRPTATDIPRPTATATRQPLIELNDLPSVIFLLIAFAAFCGAGLLTLTLLFIVWLFGGSGEKRKGEGEE